MIWIIFAILYILIVLTVIVLCRAGAGADNILEGDGYMTKNYFAIEREGQCADHVCIQNNDGAIVFEDVMNMSYDEIKSYEYIDEFVVGIMDAANKHFGDASDKDTIINLVGEDDLFVWGIIIGPGDGDDEFKYAFVDWSKNGKKYRYEKD